MSKLRALKTLLKNPKKVLSDGIVAQHELKHKQEIISKFGIDQLPTVDLLKLCPDLKNGESINYYSYLDGTSYLTDIILLKQLARKYENCQYLEIGSWRGESIANVSEVAQNCVSVTLSDEEMEKIEMGGNYVKVHGMFSKRINNITTHRKNSQTFDFNELGQKFDLIFVDGDHTFEGVVNDSVKAFEQRKDDSSIIVWHDYGLRFERARHSVLNGILNGIPKEKHGNLYHVSNSLCAVYIEGLDLPTYQTEFPTTPNKNFQIQIKVDDFPKA